MLDLTNETIGEDKIINNCPSCGAEVIEKNQWCDDCIQSQNHIYTNTDYET